MASQALFVHYFKASLSLDAVMIRMLAYCHAGYVVSPTELCLLNPNSAEVFPCLSLTITSVLILVAPSGSSHIIKIRFGGESISHEKPLCHAQIVVEA